MLYLYFLVPENQLWLLGDSSLARAAKHTVQDRYRQQFGEEPILIGGQAHRQPLPTDPDPFVVATCLMLCRDRGINFDSKRDEISYSIDMLQGGSIGTCRIRTQSPTIVPSRAATQLRTAESRRIDWIAYVYLLPAVLIITVFHILPAFYAFWISTQGGRIRNFRFVGLDHYINALQAPEFWGALTNTVVYVLGTVPITLGIGLLVAVLLFQKIRGRGVYRVIYFLPHVISAVASAIVWAWVFNPTGGVANRVIELFGIPSQKWLLESDGVFKLIGMSMDVAVPEWAYGPSLAFVAVMIFALWQHLGFNVIIFLAGLTNINSELYEAGRIDGANGWQLFRHITIPLLAPTIFFLFVISIIGSFQAFNHIFTMNIAASQPPGGPLGTTRTVSIYMFDQLYSQNRAGYATAVAVILSVIIFALTLVQFRVFERGGSREA